MAPASRGALLNRNHMSQLGQDWLLIITSKQLRMQIKDFFIFLRTLGAKSVSGHHMRRMYVISGKNGAQVQIGVRVKHESVLYTGD